MWMIRGSPRTPDRLPGLSGSRVQQSEVLRIMTGACGPYNQGGSATSPFSRGSSARYVNAETHSLQIRCSNLRSRLSSQVLEAKSSLFSCTMGFCPGLPSNKIADSWLPLFWQHQFSTPTGKAMACMILVSCRTYIKLRAYLLVWFSFQLASTHQSLGIKSMAIYDTSKYHQLTTYQKRTSSARINPKARVIMKQ